MKLPKEAVEEFQQIYNSKYPDKINYEEAEVKASQFLRLLAPEHGSDNSDTQNGNATECVSRANALDTSSPV